MTTRMFVSFLVVIVVMTALAIGLNVAEQHGFFSIGGLAEPATEQSSIQDDAGSLPFVDLTDND